jgi:hypothetical protein
MAVTLLEACFEAWGMVNCILHVFMKNIAFSCNRMLNRMTSATCAYDIKLRKLEPSKLVGKFYDALDQYKK